MNPDDLLHEVLILDIESWSDYDIKSEFDSYVSDAKVKWIGFYSYKTNKDYLIQVTDNNRETVKQFIDQHKVIVTWNGEEFDIPICKNDNHLDRDSLMSSKYKIGLDLMKILKDKKRSIILGYKFKSFSLKNVAKDMGLEVQKGDIDYKIFKKDVYTEEETKLIKEYLKGDIYTTKGIFDYLYSMFHSFHELLDDKDIKNWQWMGCASGSLSYKVMCHHIAAPEEYGEYSDEVEEVGGLVITPTGEEYRNVWYFDFTSLYPVLMIMFNIFGNPTLRPDCKDWFTGNEMFKVNGKYAKDEQHTLAKLFINLFWERVKIKKTEPHKAQRNKILMNGGYGVLRSPMFKSLYYQHSGADICYLGQQMNILAGQIFEKYGFKTVFGDTDSRGFIDAQNRTIEEQWSALQLAKQELNDVVMKNVPFPFDGFNFNSETGDKPVVWMGFNLDKKTNEYKKKCYTYIKQDGDSYTVKNVGLPLIKDNATELGLFIFKKHIEPRMIKELHGKFEEEWLRSIIDEEVEEHWQMLGINYNVKNAKFYKSLSNMNAQISIKYFNGAGGRIKLYKNIKVGKVGRDKEKYCTYEEAINNGLKYTDFDLDKLFNELEPFVKGGFSLGAKKKTVTHGWF